VVYEEYLVSLSTLMRLYMPHDQIIQRDTHLAYFFSSALPTMMVMLVLVGAWAMSHIYRLRRNRYRLHQNVVAKNKQLDSTLQLQQKQKLHLEILLQAIEQGATMIVLLCEKHRIEYCNASYFRSAEACLGAFDQCAHGSSNAIDFLDTLVEAEDRTMLADVFQNLAAGGVWQGEYARKGIGDQKVFVMAAVSAVENPETGLCKYVVVEEDITVKMETERYLRVAKEDADQANRAKSEFLSSVSHELRTPLNAVIGFAQFLDLDLHNNLTTQQKEYIGHIQESGEYLLTLIEGVLDLAQIEAGKMSVSLERVDIVQTIRDVVVVIQAFADSRDVSVQLDRVPAAPLYIMADNIRIKQALLNLLNNAIKYNKVGGLVDVRVDDKQSSVRIAISDTGYGIPKGRIGELFERFNRLGRTSADADGTGIGLAITKELVHAMGGTIGCYSREDEGATFWIRMPAIKTHIDYPKQPIDAARKPSAPKGDTTENGRVFDTDAVLCPIKDVDVTRLLAHKTIVCFGNGAHFTTQMGDMFGDIQGGKFVKVRSTQVDHLELKSYAPDLVLLHIGTEHHVRQAQRVLAQDGVASLLFIILCDHHMIAALHDVLQETPRTVVVFETPNSVDNFIKVLKCALERAQNTPLHLGHAPRTPAADEHAED
jgi:signal transduction histidine kinase